MCGKAHWSRRILCWASLTQESVRLTLALDKTILLGLVTVLKYGPLSSKEKFREASESKSGSFPMYYCPCVLSLKDYFYRRQNLGFQIFPYHLQIFTLFFHLFLLIMMLQTDIGRKGAHISLYIFRACGSDPDSVSSLYLPCRDTSCRLGLFPRRLQERS